MKCIISGFLIVTIGIIMFGCSKIDSPPNNAKAITEFKFISQDATGIITETTHTIAITVPYGTDVTSLIPTITHTGTSISPASGETQNFTNPVTYTVTAADGSTQTYQVTVTPAINPAKAITAFNFISPVTATGVITEADHTITITVPYGTDVKTLTPTITHTGVSVNPASGVAHDFTDPATYTVTAGDSSTQDYIVTVTIWTPISGMIPVPSGIFSRDGVSGNDSTVSAFQMSDKEITRSLFTTVTALPDPSDTRYTNDTNDPVQMVKWYHALVFCNKLSALEGRTPVYSINGSTDPAVWITANGGVVPTTSNADWDAVTANWLADGYRLPTEMEWMWAAMGADTVNPGNPNTTGYAKTFAGSTGSNAIGNYAWTSENSSGTTHPTGTKLPNELGLYDMSGNVFEWCWDWWTNTYPSGVLTDYRGAVSGTTRVAHGGTFLFGASPFASIAYRNFGGPSVGYSIAGFRVVRQP